LKFEDFGFSRELLKGISDSGFESATPIQEQLIPLALEGKDVVGSAETGSGKTAAFILPVLQQLQKDEPGFRCLVLEPTRELAIQVNNVAGELSRHTGVKSVVVFGGAPIGQQMTKIRAGADIIVATPGRLLDMAWNGYIDFDRISHLVVDEVDRMFDMGFIDDVDQIVSFLPRRHFQKMFFSATLPEHVTALIGKYMTNPETVVIGRRSKPAEGITHELYIVNKNDKLDALVHILRREKIDSAIIFSETKHGADRLTDSLKKAKFDVAAFHSGFDQVARYDLLRKFRNGKVKILVATNVAARGLDITGISHIFNYDVPTTTEDYVHRIGRSARADATGLAVTFACPAEARYLRAIEKLIEMELPVKQIDGLTMDKFPPPRRRSKGRKRSGYSGKRKPGKQKPGGRKKPGRPKK